MAGVCRPSPPTSPVVVAYGLILPPPVLAAPASGPTIFMRRCCRAGAARRRSSAPSWPAMPRPASWSCAWPRSSIAGRSALPRRVAITPGMTAGELHDRLAERGARLMVRACHALEAARSTATRKPETASPTPRSSTSARRASTSPPGGEVRNRIHGLSPYPGAWFQLAINGKRRAPSARCARRRRRAGQSRGTFSTTG